MIMKWNLGEGGLCTYLLAFTLSAEENHGKSQVEDRLMKAVRPVIVSNVVRYCKMTSHVEIRKKEKKKHRKSRLYQI